MWTITGQTGKALNATSRTLAEIGALGPKVTFRSLAADSMTWGVMLAELAPTTELIPEIGQEIALFRSGSRVFCGHVANVRQAGHSVTVTVNNAWWWLERVFLSSTQTDGTGATGTRASFALAAGDLSTSFAAVANAAIALGVPMSLGALAATFNAPELRLNQQSFGQALAEIARVTPDLVTWFDYSVGGYPALRTSRRLSAGTVTIDADAEVTIDLNPLTQMEVSAVDVPYLVRAADGAKQFAMQSAGTRAMGKTQLMTVSGDEMDTFLPKDLLDVFENMATLDYATASFVANRDSTLKGLLDKYGYLPGSPGTAVYFYIGTTSFKSPVSYGFPGISYLRADGTPRTGATYLVASGGTVPEWLLKAYGGEVVTVSGTWIAYFQTRDANGDHAVPDIYYDLERGGEAMGGFDNDQKFGVGSDFAKRYSVRSFSFQATVINTPFYSYTDVYRPSDYGFAAPPPGFAAGLLAAQSYRPYEGSITIPAEECGATRYLPSAINVSNSMPDHASMKAMASSEEWDLQTGDTTVVLGPPARFSYRELVNRLRGSSNDNILYV